MKQDQNFHRDEPVKKKKFRPTKRFIIGAVVLTVLVVAIVVAAFLLANTDRRPNYSLYVKNGALYYTDFRGKSFRVTSNLTTTDGSLPNVDYDLRYCATLSDNGSYLFFPENMTISGEDVQTFDLCYQNVSKKERETVRIAQNVTQYHISSDAMTVTYLTAEGLYQYELKPAQSNLLCNNVYKFFVSHSSSRLVYLTGNNELYAQTVGYDRVKIDNMVDEVLFVDQSFKSVIYRQENSLHKWISGKGETEICADAISWKLYDSGEGLFLSNAVGYSQLYYYDGQDAELIKEYVEQLLWTAEGQPVALLTAPAEQKNGMFLINGDTVYQLEDMQHLRCVGMNGSGKSTYFVEADAQYSTLYELNMGAFGLEDLQIYDTEVYCENITVTGDGKVIYYKEVDQAAQTGKLYLNTAELNSQVPLEVPHFQPLSDLPESKQIYYFTSYDPEKHTGALHAASTDGSNRQISGSAVIPFMLHNGQILFMENYQAGVGGDLYAYINGSTLLIDTDVTFYIPVM